jgi:two-component system sensor kinase FixL
MIKESEPIDKTNALTGNGGETAEQIAQLKKQLEEFVYIVSHDLKAPLRGLISLTVFLEEELGSNISTEAKDLLGLIRSRSARMQILADAILHYSRIANGKAQKEDVNIKNLINNIIDLLTIPSTIRIEMQDSLPTLHGEKIKLHEIFQNLISNAVKYNKPENGVIKINSVDLGNQYQFTIEDTGIGIKEEHFEKIFKLFQTLQPKDTSENTGIGLTIVKKLVEEAGGKVWLESEIGKGTKFHFTSNKQ